MTSRLLRKRRTTVRGRSTSARRVFELAGLALLLLGARVSAQSPLPMTPVPLGAPRPLPAPMIGQPPSLSAPTANVQPARFQPMPAPPPIGPYGIQPKEQTISLDPPGNERLHKLESEAQLQQR